MPGLLVIIKPYIGFKPAMPLMIHPYKILRAVYYYLLKLGIVHKDLQVAKAKAPLYKVGYQILFCIRFDIRKILVDKNDDSVLEFILDELRFFRICYINYAKAHLLDELLPYLFKDKLSGLTYLGYRYKI